MHFDRLSFHTSKILKLLQILLLSLCMAGLATCKQNSLLSSPRGSNPDQSSIHDQFLKTDPKLKVYRLAIKENVESFDPVNSVDETSGIILNLLHRNLFTTDVKGNLINDLVEQSRVNANAVYVSIKPGVYFNVGSNINQKSELTSEDVVYSLRRLKDSGRQPWILDKVADLEPLGRYSVIFYLKHPGENSWERQKYLLSLPQCAIYSKNEHIKNNRFTGASSFTVTDYQPGSLELGSKDGYRLDYKVISSDSNRWFFYQRDLLDVYETDGVFRFLKNQKHTYNEINVIEPVVLYGAIVSDEKSVLNQREFRRALNYRFDRQNVASKILMNAYQAADYPVPDIFRGNLPELYRYDENHRCYNPAGGSAGGANKYTQDNLYKGEVVHIYSTSDRDRQLVAMVIKKVLSDCGIKSTIKIVDLSTLLKINNEKRTGIYLLKWVADYPHAENFIIPLFHSRNSGSGGNRSYYKNERLDSILDNGGGITDENIKSVEEMIREDAPWIFIGFSKKQYYVSKDNQINLPMMYTGWNEEVFNGRAEPAIHVVK